MAGDHCCGPLKGGPLLRPTCSRAKAGSAGPALARADGESAGSAAGMPRPRKLAEWGVRHCRSASAESTQSAAVCRCVTAPSRCDRREAVYRHLPWLRPRPPRPPAAVRAARRSLRRLAGFGDYLSRAPWLVSAFADEYMLVTRWLEEMRHRGWGSSCATTVLDYLPFDPTRMSWWEYYWRAWGQDYSVQESVGGPALPHWRRE